MTTVDTQAVFMQYLQVVNSALDEHRTTFPYKQIIAAGEEMLGGREIGVAVYKEDPKEPHDWFTIRFRDGKLLLREHGKRAPAFVWRMKEDYLRQVADNPSEYIEHPAKLDLDWLKARLGID